MPPLDPIVPIDDLEDVTGAFEIEVVARFDDLEAGYWQRVFDFGNGPRGNNLILTQEENGSGIMFALYQDGTTYRVTAPDAIVEGETATWKVGIDANGTMWIDKNGVRLVEGTSAIPTNELRVNELLGASNWADDTPLDGAVLGIDVTNAGDVVDGGRLNAPTQIDGAFQLDVVVRFDSLEATANQTVFDFGGTAPEGALRLHQVGTTDDLRFTVVQDGVEYSLTAADAIIEGELAIWSVGINADGRMWVEKDGVLLAEGTGIVPADIERGPLLVGESGLPDGGALDGIVLDLTVTPVETGTTDPVDPVDPADPIDPVDPTDPVDPIDPTGPSDPADPTDPPNTTEGPQQIDGAFRIDVTVRFDDIDGGYWQRIIDFGDGPASNNILFTQIDNTSGIMLELWQDGQVYRVVAEGVIVEGETADWSFGIDESGLMWIDKDGTRLAEDQGVVPEDEERANLLVGQSNWAGDAPLIGEIGSLFVYNGAVPTDPIAPEEPIDPVDPVDPTDPTGPTDPVDPAPPVVGSGDMVIVAHQDDDLLFMNPTLDGLIDGDGPVTTIYLTAGDAGRDESYWAGREAGEKAAYGHMAGADDWVDETVSLTVGDQTFDVASSYLASQPEVRLYFLRLPDGFGDGSGSETYGFQSLEQLAEGEIATVTAVDGSATYTSDDLTGVLSALLDLHTPDHIHIQDHTTEYSGIEHSDHLTSAAFATDAVEGYNADFTVTSYVGYASWGLEENLSPEDELVVRSTFDTYASHDPLVFGSDGALIGAYEDWVQREYIANEYDVSASGTGLYDALMLPPDSADLPEEDDAPPAEAEIEVVL
ncbi:PIG-L family deacetylase [Antarctobacter sp.]|uniref:PIG-L family deacetylase n=1 Tax=Antarctobacter sp. TaxID=1872577 RepID=UPI002B278F37|nr:PIG-L family deacetylase [Antarctobacter sp.]